MDNTTIKNWIKEIIIKNQDKRKGCYGKKKLKKCKNIGETEIA